MLPVPAPKKFSRYESSVTELNADRPPGYTQVLFGVNGMARPGHVLAVMGTSGSGKTTLLNVLADSQLKGTIVRGSVRVNGITLGSHIRDLSAYVKQHYMFDGTLSVKETLMFRALLKTDDRMDYLAVVARDCTNFFVSLSGPLPRDLNPVDFYFHTLAIVPGDEAAGKHHVHMICRAFSKRIESRAMKEMIHEYVASPKTEKRVRNALLNLASHHTVNWCQQFEVVLWRTWLSFVRRPRVLRVRLLNSIVVAVFIGLVFLRVDPNPDQKSVMNVNGAMFLLLMSTSLEYVYAVLDQLPDELKLFVRDYRSNLYRADVYYLSRTLVDLPMVMLCPVISVIIVYPMVSLYKSWIHFLRTVAIILLTTNVAVGFGHVVASMTTGVGMALAVASPLVIPLVTVSGFFVHDKSLPVYFLWLKFLSWFRLGGELLFVNQWSHVHSLGCAKASNSSKCVRCRYTDGTDVLDSFGFSADNNAFNVGILAFLLIFFRLAAFLVLLARARSAAY
nr:hypothetical protein BaRGS_015139 [Batillaria attramentaria]